LAHLPDFQKNIFVWYKTLSTVHAATPPIARHLSMESNGCALLETQFSFGPSDEIVLRGSFEAFTFYGNKKRTFITTIQNNNNKTAKPFRSVSEIRYQIVDKIYNMIF